MEISQHFYFHHNFPFPGEDLFLEYPSENIFRELMEAGAEVEPSVLAGIARKLLASEYKGTKL